MAEDSRQLARTMYTEKWHLIALGAERRALQQVEVPPFLVVRVDKALLLLHGTGIVSTAS